MKKEFCFNCNDYMPVHYEEMKKKETIGENTIEYIEKHYVCEKCGDILFGDLLDYNTHTANNELRKKTGLITVDEINQIMKKYDIGKKPLSLVLGLGEITLTRYLEGRNPTRANSDMMKMVLNNPFLYEMYLEVNRDKITKIAYKKSLGKAKQLELQEDKSKIYSTSLYIIGKEKELDTLELQKTLYFSNLLSMKLNKNKLFNDYSESWKYGPVYRDIYEAFSYYGSQKIDYEELVKDKKIDLTDEEKEFLDAIIDAFGYYNGRVLREMTHLTDPWIKSREGLQDDESSCRRIEEKDMEEYADKIIKEYNIKELKDIKKYSEALFEQAKKNLENKRD